MRLVFLFHATLCLLLVVVGCDNPAAVDPPPSAAASVHSYQVRGLVKQVAPGDPDALVVQHEAIPDFRDRDGNPSGMPSMTMRFETAEGVSVSTLKAGDKVSLTVEVPWPTLRITHVEKLPADTALSF